MKYINIGLFFLALIFFLLFGYSSFCRNYMMVCAILDVLVISLNVIGFFLGVNSLIKREYDMKLIVFTMICHLSLASYLIYIWG